MGEGGDRENKAQIVAERNLRRTVNTTSSPAFVTGVATVEFGAASGAAPNDVLDATQMDKMDRRMGRNLDSTERATLNWTRPIPAYSKTRARFNRAPAAFLDESRILFGPTLFMPRLKKRLVFAAALVLLILFWAIAVGPEPPARISISAEELVRAVTIQRDSLIDLCLIEHVDPNGRDAQGRTPLLIAMSQPDWKTARRLLDAGALVDVADKNGFTPLMAAAMYGNAETFQLLLARTDNLHAEAPTNDGRDLLEWRSTVE